MINGWALREVNLRQIIKGKDVLVFGCGPSLDRNLSEIMSEGLQDRFVLFTADGATTALMRENVIPCVVVTDLDGRIGDIQRANVKGSIVAVHAHGDNVINLRKYVPTIKGNIIGTTQVMPRNNVYNFGGFTDGDRCVFIAEHMKAKLIVLAGMDFGNVVGKYSKPRLRGDTKADPIKRMKLAVATHLIEWISNNTEVEIVNITGVGEGIRGVPNVPYSRIKERVSEH
jgi:uncharacterized Rossmann fold enzyme